MTEIDDLYAAYNTLTDAKDEISKFQNEYAKFIVAAGGNNAAKLLACQFLPKFFKSFPDLMNNALNAHIDLCEDSDIAIRISAIKNLPQYCNDLPRVVPRISAILTQMILAEPSVEATAINDSLTFLFNSQPLLTLRGMFDQIPQLEVGSFAQACKFIQTNVAKHKAFDNAENAQSLINDEDIITLSENDINNSFEFIINILSLKRFLTHSKDAIAKIFKAKLNIQVLTNFTEVIKILTHAHKYGLPSIIYEDLAVAIFIEAVQPTPKDESFVKICRLLAVCLRDSAFSPEFSLNKIFDIIFDFLPVVPADAEILPEILGKYKFNWEILEAMLVAFQALYNKNPSFNGWNVKGSETIKPFVDKLQFLHRIVLNSIAMAQKTSNKNRILAPGQTEKHAQEITPTGSRATIISFIKDFVHTPPIIGHARTDWLKQMEGSKMIISNTSHQSEDTAGGHKRISAPIGTESKPSKVRVSPQLYVPPGSKRPTGFGPSAPPDYTISKSKFKNRTRFR